MLITNKPFDTTDPQWVGMAKGEMQFRFRCYRNPALDTSDVQAMTEQLRRGLVARAPAVELKGEVEIDEVYVVAGHKGQPDEVAKRGGSGAAASWQARRDAARWRKTSRLSSA